MVIYYDIKKYETGLKMGRDVTTTYTALEIYDQFEICILFSTVWLRICLNFLHSIGVTYFNLAISSGKFVFFWKC